MQDELSTVDELLLLVEVVEAGGFSAASLRTGVPKSRLSRRIGQLEERLGVCLIKRTSRRFEVTELGQRLHAHGALIRSEIRAALTAAHDSGTRPAGPLRVACPIALSALVVADVAVAFAQRYPDVRLTLHTTHGVGKLLLDRFDLVIHPTVEALPDSDLVAVKLLESPYEVVAAPGLFAEGDWPVSPQALNGGAAIGWNTTEALTIWRLHRSGHAPVDVSLRSLFCTDNLLSAHKAALAGLGMARLPLAQCCNDLLAGRLRRVVPGWSPAPMAIYALYSSRREMSMAGRAFVEMVATKLRSDGEHCAAEVMRLA